MQVKNLSLISHHLLQEDKLEEGVGIARGGQGAGICQTRVWNINSTMQCLLTKIYEIIKDENMKCRHIEILDHCLGTA